MRAVLLLSVCGVGVLGAPTTTSAPSTVSSTTVVPEKSSALSSATINSNVTIAANATEVDKKIFPFTNQGYGLQFPGFQGAQSPFGNGFGLNPSFSPFQGNLFGQYPTGQNVFPQGLYTPQNANPFYSQGGVQPATVLGQPSQSPGNQGFQPGQSPQGPNQLPPSPFSPGQLPQGPQGPFGPQGQFPPGQFPPQQFPQNGFPQGQQPASPGSGSNGNGEGPSAPTPASANGNDNPAPANPAPGGEGQREQQDGQPDPQNPGEQPNAPNAANGAGQLQGQFPGAGFQGLQQTLTGSPQLFRTGGPAFNQNFFSPSYQFLPNGQFLPQRFDGQLLTPGVFAGQGNVPTQLNPNQPQNPQAQGQLFQNPLGGSPQNAQGPQGGFFPQGGFPPGFQGGYPQVPQGVFTQGPQGAFVPNPTQGGFPQGAAPNLGSFQPGSPVGGQPNPTQGPPSGATPVQPGNASPQPAANSSNGPELQGGSSTQSRGVSPGDGGTNGPNQPRPFPADQAPQPSQGSELRSPPGDLYNQVSAVERQPSTAQQTEGASISNRPATRRPDP